jgi:hypothetical protein
MEKMIRQYDEAFAKCKHIFITKGSDYGTSWRILRLSSVIDQLYIKAKRIRTIDEKGTQKIGDSIEDEFMACLNYSIIALMQMELKEKNIDKIDLSFEEVEELYNKYYNDIKQLMLAKNHDYGEAWRDMRLASFTDMILTRIHRIKQMENHQNQSKLSEGIDANFKDIANYAIFALIQLSENK